MLNPQSTAPRAITGHQVGTTNFGIGEKRRIPERIQKGRDNIHGCGTTLAAIESNMAPSNIMRTSIEKRRWM